MVRHRTLLLGIVLVLVAFVGGAGAGLASRASDELVFGDVKAQTQQFIEYERTIELTPAQEAVKKEALSQIPAPCCSDNTAYTCCCPCNMAKAIWGMSAYLITEKGADAAMVRKKTEEWVKLINPDGFPGDTCYTSGGCGKAFAHGGCGGMNAERLVF
jgi:hypothetical protein